MQHGKKQKEKSHPKKTTRSQSGLARLRTLEPFFARLLQQFHTSHWISSDPIQYAHRYSKDDDREIAAFIAACFAYGSVQLVHRAVAAVLEPMGKNPAQFVRTFDGTNYWKGFYHRFHDETHVVLLVTLLKQVLSEYGSLGEMFRVNSGPEEALGSPKCEAVLNGAARWFQAQSVELVARLGVPEALRGMRFFFNAPADGSACKRMVMFLRWMVRHDEIDLGLWKWMSPADLVVPADTHVGRIAFYLRLRGGKEDGAPNWKMAREITEALKVINAKDPVSYDFALARLGILDICKRAYTKSVCERCPVEPGCRFSNLQKGT